MNRLRARIRAHFAEVWRILRGTESPIRLGVSVAVGLFIGTLPLYGLHLPLCLLLCVPCRLDFPIAYLAANISNPLMAPFLVFAEVEIGSLVLRGEPAPFDLESARKVGVAGLMKEAMVGGVLLGGLFALVGGLLAFAIARSSRRTKTPLELAYGRTVARYLRAPRKDRFYVASKLRTDPIAKQVVSLGSLGAVTDAGAGRGQLGLYLLELGHATSVVGFDYDARKIQTARLAAAEQARFEVSDLREYQPQATDTLLLIDVLHYLGYAEQDALLARAAHALRPGGRVVVRETDAQSGLRSRVTHLFEWIATRTGYNLAGQGLGFRPIQEIVTCLEAQGLRCTMQGPPKRTPLANYFIVAEKPGERRAAGNTLEPADTGA